MPNFRAYRIDDGGRFIDFAEFEACDAPEALEIVAASTEELCFEVWLGSRMVGRVDNGNRYDKAALLAPPHLKC